MPTSKPRPAAAAKKATAAKKAAPKKATKAAGGYTLGQSVETDSDLFDLELPSGATCQAQRPGVQGLIGAGILDSFDSLTSLVNTEHIQKHTAQGMAQAARISREQAEKAAAGLMADPQKMAAGFQMVDRLTAYVVTQPLVWVDYQMTDESDADWAKREANESDRIPVRRIALEDKMFLMTWAVGGSADLERFREEFAHALGGMAAIENVQDQA